MDLKTRNGTLSPGGVFKLVAVGFFIGAGLLVLPIVVLLTLLSLVVLGEVWQGYDLLVMVGRIVLTPVILAAEAILLGGLTALGVWLYQKRRPIRLVEG